MSFNSKQSINPTVYRCKGSIKEVEGLNGQDACTRSQQGYGDVIVLSRKEILNLDKVSLCHTSFMILNVCHHRTD